MSSGVGATAGAPARGSGGRGRGGRGRGGRGGRASGSSRGPTVATSAGRAVGGPPNGGEGAEGRGNNNRRARNNNNKQSNKRTESESKPAPPTEEQLKQQEDDRRREAEEAARRKEEKARTKAAAAVEEANKKQQQAIQEECQAAIDTLQTTVENLKQRTEARRVFQDESLADLRKKFSANKKSLKTDLKKCTAFVKKIKSGTAWSMKAADIVKDVASLNLSRYVEEVVTAIVEAKPKVNDVAVVVPLCQAMHERYPEFLSPLKTQLWQQQIQSVPTDVEGAKARRVFLRIWTELVARGVITETRSLAKLIGNAAGAPSGEENKYNVADPPLLVAFCKQAGVEFLGEVPASIRQAIEYVRRDNCGGEGDPSDQPLEKGKELVEQLQSLLSNRAVSAETSEVLQVHCRGAYEALVESLIHTHRKLQRLEKRCEQDRLLSGTLPEAREKGLQDARKLKDNLHKSVEALADALDEPAPSLESDTKDDDDGGAGPGIEVLTKTDGEADTGPFDDEETRAFYCDIPDFLTTMPAALLNLSPEAVSTKQEANALKYGESSEDTATSDDDTLELAPLTEEELEADEQEAENSAKEDEEETDKDTPRYKLMVLLEEELPECHRREQIDEISERFCSNHGSSKNSRKRLAKTLFLVPHARLDLLPFYSRMAATLDRVWSDIAPPLLTDLEQQFHGQAKFKKNQNLEARLRTARYLGELVKFRVAPPMVFIRCIRRCLDDFTGTNIDVACAFLESCGRFLYRLKHMHATVISLMEAMTRLSKAKNVDERLESLLKAAFFSVKPPPSGPKKKAKEYPPLEAYLRYLLMVRLDPTQESVSEVSKELLRFPWSDPKVDCGALVCRIMLKACRRGRYKTIKAIASVATSLRSQKSANEAPVRLVDAVLEELRWALDNPNFRDQQRVLTYARLLGELFVIAQVSGQVIMDQLFDFINIGHEIPVALREASKKFGQSTNTETNEEQLPIYNSAGAVSDTIAEDEEMEMDELETEKEETETKPVAVSDASKYDPRVPSQADPPNAVYRIKLVCTLLEMSAKPLVTKKNLPRVKAFMAAFQRYLFTKPVISSEVEFSLLDAFDAIESQWRRVAKSASGDDKENDFPRYPSWLEAHNAAVLEEDAEAVLEAKKRVHLEAMADPSNSLADIGNPLHDEQGLYEGSQDGSQQGSQVEEEDDDVSRSNSIEEDGEVEHDGAEEEEDHRDEDEYGDEDYDDDEEDDDYDDDDEEDFDEEEYMRKLEEEAFERELRRATMEALEKGKNTSRKLVAGDMISGSQIIKKKPSDRAAPKPDAGTAAPPGMFALGGKEGIGFQLLKRGNRGKVEARDFVVPTDTNLAVVATRNDDAAARERDEIKQRVLQYEAESAEAELTGGNVYLEQEKLQVIRNKPLSMDDIDRNFGTKRGDLATQSRPKPAVPVGSMNSGGPGRGSGGRGGRGRGGRSSSSGRTLFG